jgi:hypothetical protein
VDEVTGELAIVPSCAERRAIIAEMFAKGPDDPDGWKGRPSAIALARRWGIGVHTVTRDATETKRALGIAFSPERLSEVAELALGVLEGILASGGAAAGDKVKAAGVVLGAHAAAPPLAAQLRELAPADRLAWVEAKIAELETIRDALRAELARPG